MYIIYYTYKYISYPLYPQILVIPIYCFDIATFRHVRHLEVPHCDTTKEVEPSKGKSMLNVKYPWKCRKIYAEIEVLDTWAMFKFCNEHDWNLIWMIAQWFETWVEKLVLSNPKKIDTYFQDGSSMSCFAEFPNVSIFFWGSQQGAGVLFFPQGLCRQRGRSIVPVPLSHPAVIGQGHVGKNIEIILSSKKKYPRPFKYPKNGYVALFYSREKGLLSYVFIGIFHGLVFCWNTVFFSRSWVSVRLGWSKLLSPSLFFDFLIWEGPKLGDGTQTRQTSTDSPGSG